MIKRVGYTIAGVAALAIGAGLHYALPQVDVVRLVGTDIKRMDTKDSGAGTNSGTRTRDVYFILAEEPDGSPSNYRNEDALVYLKFDSSDLHTQARSLAQDQENIVAVRHYGWRVPFLSMFPNATKIWRVDSVNYSHFPLFNIIFFTLIAGGVGYVAFRIRRLKRRLGEDDEPDEYISEYSNSDDASSAQEKPTDQRRRDSDGAYDDFFSGDQKVGGQEKGSGEQDD